MNRWDEYFNNRKECLPDLQVDLLAAMRPLVRYHFDREFMKLPEDIRKNLLVHHTGIMAGGSDRQTAVSGPESKSFEQLPAVMLSARYLDLLNQTFYKRYFEKGLFSTLNAPRSSVFELIKGRCASDELYLYAACPFIFLIDLKLLDGLPVPEKWEDLTDPVYHGKICFNGTRYGAETILLLYFFQRFGRDGLKAVADNTICTAHGSVMVRNLGTMKNNGAAVYLIPAFFALCAEERAGTKIVYPKDDIPFHPFYLTVKARDEERCFPLLELLRGETITHLMTKNGYPCADAGSLGIWEDHPLTWCPEEQLLRKDPEAILTQCRDLFPAFNNIKEAVRI